MKIDRPTILADPQLPLATCLFVFLILLLVFIYNTHLYIAPAEHYLAADFGYFLPALLNGYFWFLHNGPWAVPWFTPAICAGLPFVPNPQNLYYSVPQVLTLLADPRSSVFLTVVLFAAAGFWGFFALCRIRFHLSLATSLFAAACFLFNSFYINRMLAGHLTFHSFMLVPAIALCLLSPLPAGDRFRMWKAVAGAVLAALMLAYLLLSGGAVIYGPSLLGVVGIWVLAELHGGRRTAFWPCFAAAVTFSLCLAAFKLVPAMAFLSHFPRDLYPVPGFRDFRTSFLVVLHSLFSAGTYIPRPGLIVHTNYFVELHEFQYSVTPAPVFVFLAAVMVLAVRHGAGDTRRIRLSAFTLLRLAILVGVCLLPVIMNIHSPGLDALFKKLPYLESTFLFLRWIAADIPVVILISAMVLDRVDSAALRSGLAAAGIAGVVAVNLQGYVVPNRVLLYDPRPVTRSYFSVRKSGDVPPVTRVKQPFDQIGRALNDRFVDGTSPVPCYQPIFGYRLETFPRREVRLGPVVNPRTGQVAMFNPACYVFGKSNQCRPGDHFRMDQRNDVLAFTHYRKFPFAIPWWQRLADYLSLASFLLAFGILLRFAMRRTVAARNGARKL